MCVLPPHRQAEARLQSAKRSYLEQSLLHSELTAVLAEQRGATGQLGMAAAEAQHCLRLHPEASLLGVTTEHLRESANVGMTGVCLAFISLSFSLSHSLSPSTRPSLSFSLFSYLLPFLLSYFPSFPH